MSERETAVPLAIRQEAHRCAVQNGRIDPEYLIGLYRRGAEFRTVVDHNGEILTQAAVDRLLWLSSGARLREGGRPTPLVLTPAEEPK